MVGQENLFLGREVGVRLSAHHLPTSRGGEGIVNLRTIEEYGHKQLSGTIIEGSGMLSNFVR